MASKSIKDQLSKLLSDPKRIRELKTTSGKTLGKILEEEAQRLRNLIQQELDLVISSYHPNGWYYRTGRTQRSLEEIRVDSATNTIIIKFNHDLADHDSYFTKSNPDYDNKGFTPLLINEGFSILYSDKRYPKTHYIEKAIEKFNKNKHPGIKVRLQKSDNNGLFYDEYF